MKNPRIYHSVEGHIKEINKITVVCVIGGGSEAGP